MPQNKRQQKRQRSDGASVNRLEEPFNPRRAALIHAAVAAEFGEALPEGMPSARQVGEIANVVACGLVYIGDQIEELDGVVDAEVVDERGALLVRYADALRRIVGHEEAFGSGPPDEDMRAIARQALEGIA